MHGFICWVGAVAAMAGMPPGGWFENYSTAWHRARQEGKPLLVVLEAEGQEVAAVGTALGDPRERRVVPDGAATGELLKKYVLCRIDATTPYGQRMVRAFQADAVPFVSIIDTTGKLQIFRKAGPMSEQEWEVALATYQDGKAHAVSSRPSARLCRT